jgi:hypothetical protein
MRKEVTREQDAERGWDNDSLRDDLQRDGKVD